MNLEVIPPAELSKYLNQVDLGNLTLTNKSFNQYYHPYLDKIKAFLSTRANCLSIYINYGEKVNIVTFTLRNHLKEDLIEPSEIITDINKDKFIIAEMIMAKVPIKEGDIIRFKHLYDKNIHEKYESEILSYDIEKYGRHSYLFINGSFQEWVNFGNFEIGFSISLDTYSIYHWDWIAETLLFSIPYFTVELKSVGKKYLEIDAGDFYYRVKYNALYHFDYSGKIFVKNKRGEYLIYISSFDRII